MSSQPQAIDICYSYSHKDEGLRDELEKHLSLLKRQGIIRGWHDRKIGAGDEWAVEIDQHFRAAHLILLLISADFLASDYCYDKEMRFAMERHEAGSACVVPVILRACDWQSAPFGKLQALPKETKPVTCWDNRDEAWFGVVAGIRATIEQLRRGADAKEESFPVRVKRLRFAQRTKPDIPPLLPYLCDRNEQERALGTALRRQQAECSRRPFIMLIHGDEMECHGGFLERMQYTSMPRILNLEARQHSIKHYLLPWPSPGVQRRDYSEVLWQNLGFELMQDSSAAPEQIIEFISRHEEPLLITSDPLTESFEPGGAALLEAYLDFWRAWPDLARGRTLFACLSLKHQHTFGHMGRWRRWKLKKLRAQLRSFIATLDLSIDPTLPGVVLPELQGIRRGDVETWLRSQPVRALCAIHEREIRDLYARPDLCTADGQIAMEPLVEELRHLLDKYCR